MNKTEIALAAAGVTIVVLGTKLAIRTRQVNLVVSNYNKLLSWAKIRQRMSQQIIENNPEVNLEMPEDIMVDIAFFNIINKENLT